MIESKKRSYPPATRLTNTLGLFSAASQQTDQDVTPLLSNARFMILQRGEDHLSFNTRARGSDRSYFIHLDGDISGEIPAEVGHIGMIATKFSQPGEYPTTGLIQSIGPISVASSPEFAREVTPIMAARISDGTPADVVIAETFMNHPDPQTSLLITQNIMAGYRHAQGSEPLAYGKLGDIHLFASEDDSMAGLGATDLEEIPGGGMYLFDGEKLIRSEIKPECLDIDLEQYTNISRLGTTFSGVLVSRVHEELGRELALVYPQDRGVVVPIPVSGIAIAQTYHRALPNLGYQPRIVKDRFTYLNRNKNPWESGPYSYMPVDKEPVILIDNGTVSGKTSSDCIDVIVRPRLSAGILLPRPEHLTVVFATPPAGGEMIIKTILERIGQTDVPITIKYLKIQEVQNALTRAGADISDINFSRFQD